VDGEKKNTLQQFKGKGKKLMSKKALS